MSNKNNVRENYLYTNGKTTVLVREVWEGPFQYWVDYCQVNSTLKVHTVSVTGFLRRYPKRVKRIEIVEE